VSDAAETYCRQQLVELQRRFQIEAKPYIDQLVKIEAMKPPPHFMFVKRMETQPDVKLDDDTSVPSSFDQFLTMLLTPRPDGRSIYAIILPDWLVDNIATEVARRYSLFPDPTSRTMRLAGVKIVRASEQGQLARTGLWLDNTPR
jgi:hypothetical protein